MSKRGNGEGSIYPFIRGGVKVGYRGAYWVYTSGGPKRRYISGKTRDEVRRKLAKAMSDSDSGFVYEASDVTVGDYLDRWLKDVEGTVRESTFHRYEYAVRPHIKPALGGTKLRELTPAHIRWFYRDRQDSGLAPASVHKLHIVLHKALKTAVADGLVPRNAAYGLKLPKTNRKEIVPLNRDEARRLIETAKETRDRFETLYVLALSTGMRQGELLALKWDDLDLENGSLRVRRTLTKVGKSYVTGEPKTKKSRRTIRLTHKTIEALKAHLARQLAEIEAIGSLYQPGGLVFATEIGTIFNPSNLRNRSLKPLIRAAGLRSFRFHDLRHTCATILLLKNVNPKIVSEMLGHASVAMTLDIYSHLMPEMQEAAVTALEESLW